MYVITAEDKMLGHLESRVFGMYKQPFLVKRGASYDVGKRRKTYGTELLDLNLGTKADIYTGRSATT